MKTNPLTLALLSLLGACASVRATPGAQGFDTASTAEWKSESTGGFGPTATWAIHPDPEAISKPNVVAMTAANHTSEDRFNLHWTSATRFTDGKISVAVRADAGTIDQGGGPMWRVKDADNYYVCRFNPLESNFRVYVVKSGARKQLATHLLSLEAKRWYRIEIEQTGDKIVCSLDGKKLLEATDASLQGEGGVGLWTKADARTSFDDLSIVPAKR